MEDLNKELNRMITAPNMSGAVESAARACGYITLGGKEYEVQLAFTQNKDMWIGEKANKALYQLHKIPEITDGIINLLKGRDVKYMRSTWNSNRIKLGSQIDDMVLNFKKRFPEITYAIFKRIDADTITIWIVDYSIAPS